MSASRPKPRKAIRPSNTSVDIGVVADLSFSVGTSSGSPNPRKNKKHRKHNATSPGISIGSTGELKDSGVGTVLGAEGSLDSATSSGNRTASAVVASATKPSLPFMASLPLMKNEDMSIEDVKARYKEAAMVYGRGVLGVSGSPQKGSEDFITVKADYLAFGKLLKQKLDEGKAE